MLLCPSLTRASSVTTWCASLRTASLESRSSRSRKTSEKWLHRAKVETGAAPGTTRSEVAELREARKRIRLLEQENEVLRRAAAYLSQANLPGKGSTRL